MEYIDLQSSWVGVPQGGPAASCVRTRRRQLHQLMVGHLKKVWVKDIDVATPDHAPEDDVQEKVWQNILSSNPRGSATPKEKKTKPLQGSGMVCIEWLQRCRNAFCPYTSCQALELTDLAPVDQNVQFVPLLQLRWWTYQLKWLIVINIYYPL